MFRALQSDRQAAFSVSLRFAGGQPFSVHRVDGSGATEFLYSLEYSSTRATLVVALAIDNDNPVAPIRIHSFTFPLPSEDLVATGSRSIVVAVSVDFVTVYVSAILYQRETRCYRKISAAPCELHRALTMTPHHTTPHHTTLSFICTIVLAMYSKCPPILLL